jgi:putative membrane protein
MSYSKFFTISIVPALLLTACDDKPGAARVGDPATSNAAASDSAMAPATSTPTVSPQSAPDYLTLAGAGDLFEIESSKAVLEKTRNFKIRGFAQMMVKQHQGSTAKLKAAASQAKLTVQPPMLMPVQQSMLDRIKAASADSVDAAYLAAQKSAHQEALALHQGYAASGEVAPLKQAASEIVPVVRSHVEILGKLGS